MMLALSGCLLAAGRGAPETTVPSATPAQEQVHNNVKKAIRWKTFHYACQGGVTVAVSLADTLAKVFYDHHQYVMKQTQSADGNRYSDGKLVWWGKGDGGFLQEDTPNGNGKLLAKDCKLVKTAEQPAGEVTGTVTYRQRMALPPNAQIEVSLEDVSQADAAAKLVAEQKMTLGERQVPVPFALKFDPAKIDPTHSYGVRAKIVVDGEVRFASDQAYPVLTMGHPSSVEVLVEGTRKNGN
jgi:uncharacterized lipoprotein YbaY